MATNTMSDIVLIDDEIRGAPTTAILETAVVKCRLYRQWCLMCGSDEMDDEQSQELGLCSSVCAKLRYGT